MIYSFYVTIQKIVSISTKIIKEGISILSKCDYIIAHNERMIKRLSDLGCKSHLVSLVIFDYKHDFPIQQKRITDYNHIKIAYAGNLAKAQFLQQLDKKTYNNIQFLIYGKPKSIYQNLLYKGCIDAELLPSQIEGDYGLLWQDGYDIKEEDNYTIINNPHKLSMYIVACLPVIAWEGSYAASFIKRNKIQTSQKGIKDKKNFN